MSVSTTMSSQSSTLPTRLFPAAEASNNQYTMNPNNSQCETQTVQWGEYKPQYKLIPIPTYNVSNQIINNNVKNNNQPCANNQMNCNPPNYFEATFDRYVANIPNHNVIIGTPQNGHNVTSVMMPMGVRNGSVPVTSANNSWMNSIRSGDRYNRSATWTTNNKSNGGVRKPKRIRTAFTSQQMMELEQEYAKTRYLDRSRRIELSDILQLNERTIKIWFQNRRMKEKKDKAEVLEDSETSTTESSPDTGINNMVHICEQYAPAPNVNYMVNRPNMYVDYSNVATAMMVPQNYVSMHETPQSTFVNTYPAYSFDNNHHSPVQMEAQPSQFQIASVPKNEPLVECKEEVLPDSSTNTVEPAVEAMESVKNDLFEQKWDFSWIRSVKSEEEF